VRRPPGNIGENWEAGLASALSAVKADVVLLVDNAHLAILENRIRLLESDSTTAIASLATTVVRLLQRIPVSIRSTGDDFVATFFDATLSASGDMPEEAFDNLKDIIVTTFQMFTDMNSDTLGPLPQRQLKVLSEFMTVDE
jgi:hypothetical protein